MPVKILCGDARPGFAMEAERLNPSAAHTADSSHSLSRLPPRWGMLLKASAGKRRAASQRAA